MSHGGLRADRFFFQRVFFDKMLETTETCQISLAHGSLVWSGYSSVVMKRLFMRPLAQQKGVQRKSKALHWFLYHSLYSKEAGSQDLTISQRSLM
jgi:hypothetical protein